MPRDFTKEIRLDGAPDQRIGLTAVNPDSSCVYLSVSVRPHGETRTVEIFLVNNQREPDTALETAWLFQTELTVTALDGDSPVFLPIDDPLTEDAPHLDDPEELHLRLLYRNQLKYAAGRNVAVHAETVPELRRARLLRTTWLPSYDVPATVALADQGTPLAGTLLSMDALAEADTDTLRTGLAPLADGYETWLDERAAEIPQLPPRLAAAAKGAVFRARRVAQRIRAGIDLLTDPTVPGHEDALRAFQFANRAMAAQRRHTEIARLRRDPSISYHEAARKVRERGPSAASWRPFQLAFILLNLPAIADIDHPERTFADGVVDLLFFPTGGGKTEAYLGLTAFTFAIRRLQGVVGTGETARDGRSGVAVLMRYTLRLLTAQQFQRAAALVCAAELLRAEDPDTWGTEPFRIGLWVGTGVSPNWFTEAREQITEARDSGSGRRANVLQTVTCRGAAPNCTLTATYTPTKNSGGSTCSAATAKALTRAHSRGDSPTKDCRSSPWTRRSTGCCPVSSSPPWTSWRSSRGKATRECCLAGSKSTVPGTATGTRTLMRKPDAGPATTRKAACPR